MKKIQSKHSLALFLGFAIFVTAGLSVTRPVQAKAEEADYMFSAKNVSSAPVNDFVHSTTAGNQAKTYSTYDPTYKELVIVNEPGGADSLNTSLSIEENFKQDRTAYLGGIFLVNPDVTDYTDFTFTMKFRMTEYVNEARWVGVMYRMQTDEETGLHSGYMYTARANGQTAYTSNAGVACRAYEGRDNGFDDKNTVNAKHALKDKQYHTLTITMSGDVATHYMDGTKLRDANATDMNANIDHRSSGGFAILISQATISIESVTITRTVTPPEAETAPEPVVNPVYSVTDFSTVAKNDWVVNHKSDTNGSSVSVDENGELVVNAANTNANTYFGALLNINPGAVYTDFTFELQFRVNHSNGDTARWTGIVYRTQFGTENAPVSGYISQYRISGKNAYSGVNSSKTFKDLDVKEAGQTIEDGLIAPPLNDGEYHRLTVIMEGNTAKHYIDGFLIREAAANSQTELLGKVYTEGGFNLIVNCMEMNIKSCTITPNQAIVPEKTQNDNSIVKPYTDADIKIVNAPTVVADVTDQATLNSLSGTKKPSNAILHFNKDENIVDKDGEVLGSFEDIYASLNHAIIPVVYISDDEAADALINLLQNKLKILDIAVMSNNPGLVKKVRTACPRIRGIIEFGEGAEYTGNKLDLFNNIVGKINANYAMVAVLPQSAATYDNVRYIQARFKTVWVRPAGTGTADLVQSINSGAYGVVSSNFDKTFATLESYPQNSYTRMPYNVAHRGLRAGNNNNTMLCENSLNSVRGAIESGATHLELDGHMTKDGHIVIMHDETIDRTTTGVGRIPDMTLEQIRQYKLVDGQEIPVLEDVLALLYEAKKNGRDIVFVFELKAGKGIVEKIDSLLGTGDGQYDIRENLVIITFNNSGIDLLTSIKNVMPTTPTAYLQNGVGPNTFAGDLAAMGIYNCTLDSNYNGNTTREYDATYLTARGISSWYWTFGNEQDVVNAAKNGHLGLTNDRAGALSAYAAYVIPGTNAPRTSVSLGDKVNLTAILYDGNTYTVVGSVCFVEQTETGWIVAAAYYNEFTLFTQLFEIKLLEETKPDPEDGTPLQVVIDGENVTITIMPDGSISYSAPEKEGMKFVGLFVDEECTTPATASNVSAGMTLYVKYEANSTGPENPEGPDDDGPSVGPGGTGTETPGGSTPKDGDGVNLGLAIGLPLGIVAAAAIGITIFFVIRKKRKS